MTNIIEIQNVTKKYPGFLLDNISFDIPHGKIVGLIGENGAGKTTLISLILHQRSRDSGNIKIFGLDNIEDGKDIKNRIGVVVDECSFHDCLNPKNIDSIMKSIYSRWDSSYFNKLLLTFGLTQKKRISDYSKGMKSKLMLAVALSHHPDLLILDEVTSGLDPVARDDILHILKDFVKDGNKAVFFSTHITSDLDKIADHVAFLHKGSLVFMRSIETLKQNISLIECSESELKQMEEINILAQYYDTDLANHILLAEDVQSESHTINIKNPTLDDIMLVYIKEGKYNVGLN